MLNSSYTVDIWTGQHTKQTCVFAFCLERTEQMDSPLLAAAEALVAAIRCGKVVPGNEYVIDVSEDGSDEWTTVLQVNL